MARDHRKLRVFADAHQLTLLIYKHTRTFPRDEWYVLRLQMRKAAVSVPSNLVEGNARRTTREYVNFINISRASAAELTYLVDLAAELSYLRGPVFRELNDRCEAVCRQLQALLQKMELLMAAEQSRKGERVLSAPRGRDSQTGSLRSPEMAARRPETRD
jgi:four helix bundle protein